MSNLKRQFDQYMQAMTLRDRLDFYLVGRAPGEQWRRRARAAICRAVESYLNTHADIEAAELRRLVDDAYPFGMRKYHPYKMWLSERRAFLDLLEQPQPMSAAEVAAIDVAIDLVELGRVDEAEALLRDQAPNRLNAKCPACNAGRGRRCNDGDGVRVIPHAARVQPALALLDGEAGKAEAG